MRIPDIQGVKLGIIWGLKRFKLPMGTLHKLLLPEHFPLDAKIGSGSCVISRKTVIGNNVKIGNNVEIVAETIKIEEGVRVSDDVKIHCRVLVLKKNSRIEARTEIYGSRTPRSCFELGEESSIYADCFINTDDAVVIGDRTAAGRYCLIFTHSSYLPITHGYPVKIAPVKIGDDVWLPWHAFLLPGVTLGNGCTVGSFSLVSSSVPDNALAVGVPARIIKDSNNYRRKYSFEELDNLGFKIIDKIIENVCNSFKKKTLFFPETRKMSLIKEKVWLIESKNERVMIFFEDKTNPYEEVANDETLRMLVSVGRKTPPLEFDNWIDLKSMACQLKDNSIIINELKREMSLYGLRFYK